MKDLEIKIRMDRRQADADSKGFHDSEKRRINDLVQEDVKAMTRMRDARGRFLKDGADVGKAGADAARRSASGFDALNSTIDKGRASLGNMLTGYLGLHGAISVVTNLADVWEKVNQNALSSAKAALDFERAQRETATLLGREQAGQDVPRALDFALKTGLKAPEADELIRQFYGSIAAGMQKGNIDEDTAKQVAIEIGQTAARQGAPGGVRGDIAGLLPQFKKYAPGPEGVKQILGDMEAIRMGLTEGRGDDAPLTQSLINVIGSIVKEGGRIESVPEVAALVGTTSLSAGAARSDERTQQLLRGLQGGTKERIQFWEQFAGVEEHDTLEQRLAKVVPKLRDVAKTRDIDTFLTESGIPFEESRAIAEMLPNYEIFTGRMARARELSGSGGADVQAANRRFMRGDLGQAGTAENRKLAAEVLRGQRFKTISNIFGLEEAEQIAEGQEESPLTYFGDVFRGVTGGYLRSPIESGKRLRIEEEALNKLRGQAGALGVTNADIGGFGSFATPAEEGARLIEEIKKRGGDPYSGYEKSRVDELLAEQNRLLAEQNELMKQDQGGKKNPPLVRPKEIVSRPGS